MTLSHALAELVRQVTDEVGPSKKLAQFHAFHRANGVVYTLVERFALEAAGRRQRFGIRMVWERMRWYLNFETTDPEYKLNDHYHALYARLFMLHHPEHATLFETRRLHPEGRRKG